MSYCPNCGAQVGADRFCSYCGKKLTESTESSPNNANSNADASFSVFSKRCWEAYKECWNKWTTPNGRASASEYWLFMLCNAVIMIAASLLSAGLFGAMYFLAIIIPSVFATIRRLHDLDWPGWWTLLFLIFPVGVVIVLILCAVRDATPGPNRYGDVPKKF